MARNRLTRSELNTTLPELAGAGPFANLDDEARYRALSAREFEILRMLVAAKSREDIADTLHISVKTVFNIHYQIKSKLGVSTDIELMHAARQLKLID